jgi:hypothetical protein
MRLLRWPCRRHGKGDDVPTEEEGRRARLQAERGLRETTEQWKTVHDVSAGLERVRRDAGPDPFVAELESAMKRRPPRRPREA